jgi:hypothetical protein
MKQNVFLFLFSLGSLLAQVQDYFPLVSGSTWVYRSSNGAGPLTLRLGPSSQFAEHHYYRLDGYASRPIWVRSNGQGGLLQWDEALKAERAFLLFDGTEYGASGSPDCNQRARAETRDVNYNGPIGNSDTARQVQYFGGMCSDAGLTREVFVPNLGLVHRGEMSIVGERSVDLVYAQIGGITYLSEAGVQLSMSLTLLPDRNIAVRLVLNNRTDRNLVLNFSSSQQYDFELRNAQGESVYRWSATRLFLQATSSLTIRGEEVWQDVIESKNLRPGNYTVEGLLTPSDRSRYSVISSINLP